MPNQVMWGQDLLLYYGWEESPINQVKLCLVALVAKGFFFFWSLEFVGNWVVAV